MAATASRTPDGDALFFARLALGDTVIQACLAAGYARRSVYRWRDEDRAFASAWHAAVSIALEEQADMRLHERYERPVTYRGLHLGTRNVCPDALLWARYHALWRERHEPQVRTTRPSPTAMPTPPARTTLWDRAKAFLRGAAQVEANGR